jgi:CTP:molybdopterin cytidylyltransferase MocA
MGSPKALLPYLGSTFLETLARLFGERCEPVIVVLGAHAEDIERRNPQGLCVVFNERYLTGQTSSLQAGLRAVPRDAEGVLFTLVDHPAISLRTIDALLQRPLPLIRIPRHSGERGHPIWFRKDLIGEFLALPLFAPANQITRAHRAETEFVDVEDPGVIADIDDPGAYERLLAGSGA